MRAFISADCEPSNIKENIKTAVIIGLTTMMIIISLFAWSFAAIATDLRDKSIQLEAELEWMTQDRNVYYGLYDSVIQSYEDVVPKQQYIQDIEYLESVIRELRGEE